VKKTLAVLSIALICAPFASAGSTASNLPMHGVLHVGNNLAGVRIGDTNARVLKLWGANYQLCPDCNSPTWYYLYRSGEPLGAAVKFKAGKVVAAFTLGSPTGWRTAEGLQLGEEIGRAAQLYPALGWRGCIGYGAMTKRVGNTVTSIYTTGEAVYGFAITAPAESVCQ
jgi:hypothetical protein